MLAFFVVFLGVLILVMYPGLPGSPPLLGFVLLYSKRTVVCIPVGMLLLCIIVDRGDL